MAHLVKIKSISHLTHDVLKVVTEKPEGLEYLPGQAVDITINKPGWEQEYRTFTFTSLPEENELEFNIKTYPSHQGVTNQFLSLSAGDELNLFDVYGDIQYKGTGLFIAGGAGITPFLAILKSIEKQGKLEHNKLIFANKRKEDIIRPELLEQLLGNNFINILSEESLEGYAHGFISEDFLKKYADAHTQFYYLCGPPPMMDAVQKHLANMGISAEKIVKEAF